MLAKASLRGEGQDEGGLPAMPMTRTDFSKRIASLPGKGKGDRAALHFQCPVEIFLTLFNSERTPLHKLGR